MKPVDWYPHKIEILLDDCYEWTLRPWAEIFDVVGERVDSQWSDEIHNHVATDE